MILDNFCHEHRDWLDPHLEWAIKEFFCFAPCILYCHGLLEFTKFFHFKLCPLLLTSPTGALETGVEDPLAYFLPSDTKRKALAVKINGLYKDSCLTWLSEWRVVQELSFFQVSDRSEKKGIVVPSLTNIDELLRVCPQKLSSSQGCWKTHFYMAIKARTGSPQKESVNWISAT
jgi:hypothetical protein